MRAAGPAPGGGCAPELPRAGRGRGRGRGVRRARASFVDESLFGSPAGARSAPPGFAPPWAAAPAPGGGGGPRPRSKCRLRSHTPSFCDESLFGAKPEGPAWAAPWMRKEDVAKLHPLLWSPPPAPRNQPSLAPRSRETPLRAVHPRAPASPATAGFEAGRKGKSCVWKHPESDLGSEGRGAPSRGRSQSLSRLNASSDGPRLASEHPKTERGKNQSPLTAPATPRGPLMRGRSKSMSGPSLAANSKAVGGCKPRPPWK
ncbi:RBPJ-interacting and tubulin-associated protein 1 isoform 1-T6 [Ciconia maguari]